MAHIAHLMKDFKFHQKWKSQYGIKHHPARPPQDDSNFPISEKLAVRYFLLLEISRREGKLLTEIIVESRLSRAGFDTGYF